MTWIYVSVFEFFLLCALGWLLYRKGVDNGVLQERNANCKRLLEGQADAWGKFEARVKRYEDKMEQIEKRNNHVDVATLPDPALTELYKNPTRLDIPTDPNAVSETDATREVIPRKI